MLVSKNQNLEVHIGLDRWVIPNELMGLWAIQSMPFHRDHDIYTKSGCFSFLGWFIHCFEHQVSHHSYIARYFARRKSELHTLVAKNLVSNLGLYIPIFFYIVYTYRQDLKTNFNLSTKLGKLKFIRWISDRGYPEYKDHPIYTNNVFRPVSISPNKLDLLNTFTTDMLIDEDWYIKQYPDVQEALEQGIVSSATEHWQLFGRSEGRLPNQPKVDEAWYLSAYPDVANEIEKGLLPDATSHWMMSGRYEGRLPKKLVDDAWYLTAYPDVANEIEKGLLADTTSHWIMSGCHEGRLPVEPNIVDITLKLL